MTPPSSREAFGVLIRDIAVHPHTEVDLVAARMVATLVEVEGPEKAARLHTPEWIRERLLWHVDNPEVAGRALVGALPSGEIVGHTVLRRESEAGKPDFGLVSTTYVLPAHRGAGIASRLLAAGEAWFRHLGLAASTTWTAEANFKLIRLYQKHGYRIARSGNNPVTGTLMVNLCKVLQAEDGAA